MKKLALLFAVLALGGCVPCFALDRQLTQSVDTRTARVEPTMLTFLRGESVTYTLTPTYAGAAIRLSTNATALWTVTPATNINVYYINETAASVSTNGVAVFSLSGGNTGETTLPAGIYDSWVSITDTGRTVCVSRSILTVLKSTLASSPAAAATPLYLATSSPDGVTVIYSNGQLSAIAAAQPDLTARASIGAHTNATLTEHGIGVALSATSTADRAYAAGLTNGFIQLGNIPVQTNETFCRTNQVEGFAKHLTNNLIRLADIPSQTNSYTSIVYSNPSVFYAAGNPSGYVNRAQATNGVVLVESDTLQSVVNRGASATNIGDITGTGKILFGYEGLTLTNVGSLSRGAMQLGRSENGNWWKIGDGSYGAVQKGYSLAPLTIGGNAIGAMQAGFCDEGSSATNLATGAIQLFDFSSGGFIGLTTAGGAGSLLLGAGVASNRYAIVAGDGQASHGDGSITAGGGFFGDGSQLTNITAGQVGAVSNTAAGIAAAGGVLTNGSTGQAWVDLYAPPATTPAAPAAGSVRIYGSTVNGQESPYYQQSDGSTYRIGRDLVHVVINGTGATLSNGVVVAWTTNMTTTAHWGQLARCDSGSTMPAQGVVVQGNITNGGSGTVMWMGRTPTNYLNATLAALPYGTPLYVSSTEAGGLVSAQPQAPNRQQLVGFVNYNGAMDVRLAAQVIPEVSAIGRVWQLWSGSNSSVVVDGATKAMRTIAEGSVPVGTNTVNVLSNAQYIAYCSLPAGLTSLKSGPITVTATIWQDGGGGDAVSLAAEIYIRQTNGVQTEIATGAAQAIGTTPLTLIWSLSLTNNPTVNVTDSIMCKFKSSGFNASPTVHITDGQVSIPTPSSTYVLASEQATHTNLTIHGGAHGGMDGMMTNLVLITAAPCSSTYSNNALWLGTNAASSSGTAYTFLNTNQNAGVVFTNAGSSVVLIGTNLPAAGGGASSGNWTNYTLNASNYIYTTYSLTPWQYWVVAVSNGVGVTNIMELY